MQWQPIETAPKDGTFIITYLPPRFVDEAGLTMIQRWKGTKLQWITAGAPNRARLWQPTHWMPLPSPPKENSVGER